MFRSTVVALSLCVAATAHAQTEAADPTSLQQYQSDGTTVIAVGGVASTTTVVLTGWVSGTNATAGYKLRVEVRPVATAFTNAWTHQSAVFTGNGSTSTVTVSGLTAGQIYHWQAQTYMT